MSLIMAWSRYFPVVYLGYGGAPAGETTLDVALWSSWLFVRAAFRSLMRSIWTEIYLCHACSCHKVEGRSARPGERPWRARGPGGIFHDQNRSSV
eukprot:SAG25_NODE_19_length_23408_cov_10.997040_13_plen_95_part_00